MLSLRLLTKIPWKTLVAWEIFWWVYQKGERRSAYKAARATADAARKPLLVVGEPDGEYPCGDVTIDLRPTSVCPGHRTMNVEDLSTFADKSFGAAIISFTLAYTCKPEKALAELHRVADRVFIVDPKPWRLTSYLIPGRRWTRIGERFIKLPWGRCNQPLRYGTALGDT